MKINAKKVKQYIPITFMGICVLGFLIFTAINKDFSIADFLELTRGYPVITSTAVIIAFIIKGFVVFVPYAVIAISTMALLDFPAALVTVIVGTIVNLSVPYWTGRLTKDDWIQKILDKIPKARPYFEASDNLFLLSFTLRAMNLSNECLGLLFGSAGLKYIPYMIANGIAILPSAISYVIIGKDMNLLESLRSPIFWSAIVVDCLMVAVMMLYFKRKKKKKELEKADK
ncbi:MAG: VTT domain-containing protein [Clostridia bacterium]|nr:VTT domain-containing protein [Clostridia bacterium]